MATVGDIQVEIDTALVQNLKELAELVASYSLTNETQRKRIDEMLEKLTQSNRRAEAAEARESQIFLLLCGYGQTDGAHHKAWVIDQIARTLLGDDYDKWIAKMTADGLSWDTGIVP